MSTTNSDVRVITALFDTRAEAEQAVQSLVQHGVPREHISLHANEPQSAGTTEGRDVGFMASLRNLFLPDDDRTTYAEGVRRGGVMLVAEVLPEQHDVAVNALETSNAVDLDSRASGWRADGWREGDASGLPANAVPDTRAQAGVQAGTTTSGLGTTTSSTTIAGGPSATGTGPLAGATPAAASTAGAMPAARSTSTGATRTTAGVEERAAAIPVAEERLVVGKRDVARGTVRVRSYVVERPVEAQVTLHEEHASVTHRPVDRLVAPGEDPFQERTIEVTETTQEPVISKETHIREEVVVGKEAVDRTETVRDTVRRTEVEVEGQPAATTAAPGATTTSTSTTSANPAAPASPGAPRPAGR